jgi:hypothetical protein
MQISYHIIFPVVKLNHSQIQNSLNVKMLLTHHKIINKNPGTAQAIPGQRL